MPQSAINGAFRSIVVSSRGSSARRQDLPRVPVERHGDAARPTLPRRLDGAGSRLLMTEVHAVEEPDRDDRRAVGQRQRVEPANDVHRREGSGRLSRRG